MFDTDPHFAAVPLRTARPRGTARWAQLSIALPAADEVPAVFRVHRAGRDDPWELPLVSMQPAPGVLVSVRLQRLAAAGR